MRRFVAFVIAGGLTGCGLVAGLGDFVDQGVAQAGGAGGAGGETTVGPGGAGGGPGGPCTPDETRDCYSGPAGTVDVGLCQSGVEVCPASGEWDGVCTGEVVPAAEDCGTTDDEDCDGDVDCGATVWALRFGGNDDEVSFGVGVDLNGDVLVGGVYESAFAFGSVTLAATTNTEGDTFVGRVDAQGAPVTAASFGGDQAQRLRHLAVAPQGDITVGINFRGDLTVDETHNASGQDAVVSQLTSTFQPQWDVVISGSTYEFISGIDHATNGDMWVGGQYGGGINISSWTGVSPSSDGGDSFFIKITAAGTVTDALFLSGPGDAFARDVAVDTQGDAVLVGEFDGTATIGTESRDSNGLNDVYVLRVSSAGEVRWLQSFGDGGDEVAFAVDIDSTGAIIVGGYFEAALGTATSAGGRDAFVMKLDPTTGNPIWTRAYGSTGQERVFSLVCDADDNIIVSGRYDGTTDIGGIEVLGGSEYSPFVAKLTPDGDVIFARGYIAAVEQVDGYSTFVADNAVGTDAMGGIYLSGFVNGDMDFGTGNTTSLGATDAYVIKLTP